MGEADRAKVLQLEKQVGDMSHRISGLLTQVRIV